nr:putative ribonuclease H-like domain-containing protein [Tanacetum cinerariifolium]
MWAASKVPMLKPDEYEIWKIRIEQYIQMIDYALWKVIENGATLPKTKVMEGTKKTQRNLLKQQYENFTAPSSEMLDQTFDRLQKLVSQLELLEENLSQEDVNQKLLRILSPEWNTHVVMWKNKADLYTMSMDYLYNDLKSDQADEGPNYALMAFSSSSSDSEVSNDSTCLKSCLETVKLFKSQNDRLLKDLKKYELMVLGYKAGEITIRELRKKLEIVQKEKYGIQLNVDKFEHASKSLKKLIEYQIVDNYEFVNKPVVECKAKSSEEERKGNPQMDLEDQGVIDSGCSRHMTGNMSYLTDYKEIDRGYVAFGGNPKGGEITGKGKFIPPTPDLSFTSLDEFVNKPVVENCKAKSSEEEPKVVRRNDDAPIIKEYISDNEEENGNPQMNLQDQGVIDSGCSRHIIGNMSYLTDYKEIDGVYVAFGGNPKGGKITGKCTIKTDHKVKVIRCDNGTEFKNREMNQFCEMKGILRQFSVARTPQYNRVTERRNKTLTEAARTMLVDCSRPDWLFDIVALTRTMNYEPIVIGTQSNGFASTKASDNADPKSSHDDGSKPLSDDGKKVDKDPRKENE